MNIIVISAKRWEIDRWREKEWKKDRDYTKNCMHTNRLPPVNRWN